jgi:hypothetical protein
MSSETQDSSYGWRKGKSAEKIDKALVSAAKAMKPHFEELRPLFGSVSVSAIRVILDALTKGGTPGSVAELLSEPDKIIEMGGANIPTTAPVARIPVLVLPSCVTDATQVERHGLESVAEEVKNLLARLDISGAKRMVVEECARQGTKVDVEHVVPSPLNDKAFVESLVLGVPKHIISTSLHMDSIKGGGYSALISGPRGVVAKITGINKKMVGHIARRFMAFGISQELRDMALRGSILVEVVQ